MRIFIAGATGVIGIRLVAVLIKDGHSVAGMTRSKDKMHLLVELGAEGVLCNVYDEKQVTRVVAAYDPNLIIDLLTDLPDRSDDIPSYTQANNRIRTEGTRNLLSAARVSGNPDFIVESVAWELPASGKSALMEMERLVLEYGGTVLRYGQLYGEGTYYETEKPSKPRVHVDHATRMTADLLDLKGKVIEIVE